MKVFTYFSQIDCLNDPDLLCLWKESWIKYGWEPVILTEKDAISADKAMYDRYLVSPLRNSCPTNPSQYTLAAMLRWIAMTTVEEYCMHVDWDVLCKGFTPDMVPLLDGIPVYYAGSYCPCAISANGKGWKLIAAALEMIPHTPKFNPNDLLKDSCDQYALSIQPTEWAFIDPNKYCRNHNEPLEGATLIHYPNACTPYPRSKFIRENHND